MFYSTPYRSFLELIVSILVTANHLACTTKINLKKFKIPQYKYTKARWRRHKLNVPLDSSGTIFTG